MLTPLLLFSLSAVLTLFGPKQMRSFFVIFQTTVFFYGVAGPYYWLTQHQGIFLGIDWWSSIPRAATYINIGGLIIIVGCITFGRIFPKGRPIHQNNCTSPLLIPVLATGSVAALFVVASANSRGGLFLIAYQFSDLLIPAIVYLYALSIFDPKKTSIAATASLAFLAYCVFVGFRYKIALLVVPLIMIYLMNLPLRKRLAYSAISVPLVLAGFSGMTIVRSKFSGLDLSGLNDINLDTALYGLFAETNIIFGLGSVLDNFVDRDITIGLTPIVDSFLELLPRALFPERTTGERIYVVLAGLGDEGGDSSGTTYPFVGEYLMMGGIPGMITGCILASLLITGLFRAMTKFSRTDALLLGGQGIIAATFGYYFVSRGYMPQFAKSLLFVVLPYVFLLKTSKKLIWHRPAYTPNRIGQ